MEAAATPPTELRPLGVGEILDASIKVFLRNAVELFKAVAIVVVPVQLLVIVVLLSALPEGVSSTGLPAGGDPANPAGFTGAQAAAFFGAIFVTSAASGVAAVLAAGACFKGVSDAYLGGTVQWRDSLRFALRRLLSLVWVTICATVLLIPAFLALILPGIWLGVSFLLVVPVVLAENRRGGHALTRSVRLVRGRWWPTFAVVALAFLVAAVVSAIIGGILGFAVGIGAGDSTTATTLANQVATTIGSVLTTPFQAAVIALVYFDLRVRKEGLDVQLLAQGIGEHPPSPGVREPSAEAARPDAAE